jgi:glycerophosphoryl diester phosphodiesterase
LSLSGRLPQATPMRGAISWIRRLPGGLAAGVACVAVMSMNSISASEEGSPVERLLDAGRPLVIGHRGYNQFAPENTLPSFALAKAAGADLVELDYHHSKDGVPVVIHDAELDRTTDAVEKWGGQNLRVDSRTAEELRSLDAGRWFEAKFTGTRLPLLSEALDLIQAGGVTLIERKGGDPATLVQLLRRRNLVNKVVVQSFDWEFLQEFHQQEPRQILGALGPPSTRGGKKLTDAEKTLDAAWIAAAKKTGARVVGWNRLLTRDAVDHAHRQALKVWVYTVNDAAQANALLDLGVDGLITDNTSLIWRALALRRAAERPQTK